MSLRTPTPSLRPPTPRRALLLLAALQLACSPAPAPTADARPAAAPTPAPAPTATPDDHEARRLAELAHRVVFADRITYSYVLLLAGDPRPAPTRAELAASVREVFAANLEDEEVQLLLGLIARAEREFAAPGSDVDPALAEASDLLGLAIESHPRAPAEGPPLIEDRVLADPDLTRDLRPDERASLAGRRALLVLRAQYRDQHAVRGFRLLQTLVRLVATREGALIHDPDTLETVGPGVFSERRLQSSLGNVADQIPIVPFPDPRHPGRLRLATRGMRRFGSVDLELTGLPGDLPVLQQGTYLLHGLAAAMIDLGELDEATGFAVELPPIVTLHHSDCAAAYSAGGPSHELPRCKDCPGSVEVHLVERAAEPQDPVSHVVAQVVAPRSRSDRPGYDHPAWVREALDRVLGPPPSM